MTKKVIKNKYCSECEHLSSFEEIRILETVKVKNSMIENEHIYYKCGHCGELFEPFDDPDYNAKLDFEKYKKLNGLLSSREFKEIRLSYSLSLRQMADLIGVSYSTLSEIENGSIQSKLLNNMLLTFKDPFAVRNVYKERESFLHENFEGFLKKIDFLCVREEESLSELKEEWSPESDPTALLVGNYVHSYFKSPEAHQEFIQENASAIYKKNGSERAEFAQAINMIETLEYDDFFVLSIKARKN